VNVTNRYRWKSCIYVFDIVLKQADTMKQHCVNLVLQSTISSRGQFELKLAPIRLRAPASDEIVVEMEAAPINPADLLGIFGPVDKSTLVLGGTPDSPSLLGQVPESGLSSVAARWDRAIFLGNEGAGTVVDAGGDAKGLIGRKVAVRENTYCFFRILKAADCLLLPEDVSTEEGAAACINPLTALSMIETMRREGHEAMVHTAAASSVGQMLNRVCLEDDVGLVNIVRGSRSAELLREAGGKYVLDSANPDFQHHLIEALGATGATIAFDAIGGGPLLSQMLAAMETVNLRQSSAFSRYGSPKLKQVYVYGLLDPAAKAIQGDIGTAWSVGGWLMSWSLQKFGEETITRMRKRITDGLKTTFATHYGAEIRLPEMLDPDLVKRYTRTGTGEKFLVKMSSYNRASSSFEAAHPPIAQRN
jgi:NADPH:quinone reductase